MSGWLLVNLLLALPFVAAVVGGAVWVASRPEVTGAPAGSVEVDLVPAGRAQERRLARTVPAYGIEQERERGSRHLPGRDEVAVAG